MISSIAWSAALLLASQILVLSAFCFFAFFNYLYGIASLFRPRIPRVTYISGDQIAVVIVAFNEHDILPSTVEACEQLSYPNKLIVVADDSNDDELVDTLRQLAASRGCEGVVQHQLFQEFTDEAGNGLQAPIEIWESPGFVFFHRPRNIGFKGGSLKKVQEYLQSRGIEYMYLLDADWHPQRDALERTLEVLEASNDVAFVQTKRIAFQKGINLFQRYVALYEEGCYFVDGEGRQVLGHPILFSGCCTLFRLDAVAEVGGFTPGHLTEDLDLTDRLWIAGWRGQYLGDVVNYGEVPFTYEHFRRQQERWAAGSARAFRDFFWPIVKSKSMRWVEKLSAIRQNAYFTAPLLTGFAILLGIMTLLWLSVFWNSYEVEYYFLLLGYIKVPFVVAIYACIVSNFIEPVVMILIKTRRYKDIVHLPMMVWYAWSVLHTYVVGNIKGLIGIKMDWFRTPKFARRRVSQLTPVPIAVRALNFLTLMCLMGLYFGQGWHFGWFDEFALLLIPAFLLGCGDRALTFAAETKLENLSESNQNTESSSSSR